MWGSTSSNRISRRLRAAGVAVCAAAAATALGPVLVAGAWGTSQPCTARNESQVFSPWSDSRSYFAAPNGGFEGGLTDWLIGGSAQVVDENEPWKVGGSTHGKSLKLASGSSAESRTLCVAPGEDYFRFFYKDSGVVRSSFSVQITVRWSDGGSTRRSVFSQSWSSDGSGQWKVSNPFRIPDVRSGSSGQELTLKFSASNADWHVDDVYVDPFKSY